VFSPEQLYGFDFSQYRAIILNWDGHDINEFDGPYEAVLPVLEAYAGAGGVVWVQGDMWEIPLGSAMACLLGGRHVGKVVLGIL
jgi:hypothetical protein